MIEPTFLAAGFMGREHLGTFLNGQKLTNIGVEVGTHRALYADCFMKYWQGTLYCVDHWDIPKGYEIQSKQLRGKGENRELDYDFAKKVAKKYHPRMRLLRQTSESASNGFDDDSLDFVYIDGDHLLPGVTADFNLWYPKLKSGGILAGHDIITVRKGILDPRGRPPVDDDYGRNIRKALFALIESLQIRVDIYLIPERNENWSFFIIKP